MKITDPISKSAHCVSVSNFHEPARIEPAGKPARLNATDVLQSYARESNAKCKDAERIFKTAAAMAIGIIPLAAAKIGEAVVRASATVAHKTHGFFAQFEMPLRLIGYPFRVVIGIPALIGGVLLFGGAVVFSKTQALVWGQHLIEFPQEERLSTSLARYGSGRRPWSDFQTLIDAFFLPSKTIVFQDDAIDLSLRSLSNFKAS